ncbi:hypothetical protein ACM64Y_06510 [Novispirillum sp. DQ9]|uniref:hypothetical protein n=1 Tax=Novispirillum sp. DQ9 TaxID=3398612 RepID=UPI003C7C7AA3
MTASFTLLDRILGRRPAKAAAPEAVKPPRPDPDFYYDPTQGPGIGPGGKHVGESGPRIATEAWRELHPLLGGERIDFDAVRALLAARAGQWDHHAYAVKFFDYLEKAEEHDDLGLDLGMLRLKRYMGAVLKAGRMRTACRVARAMDERWPGKGGKTIGALLHAPDAPAASELMDRPWVDIQIVDKKAPATLILFTGVGHNFGFPLNLLHLWLGRLDANIVYLCDFNMALFQMGLMSVGPYAETVAYLRDLSRSLGQRTVLAGHSGGVFGALTMARDIPADAVLAFSGPATLELGLATKEDRPFYANVLALLESGAMTMPDLRADYKRNGIRVEYLFGAQNGFDSKQANALAGLPNVTLRPVEGVSRHTVLPELIADGTLTDVFADVLKG